MAESERETLRLGGLLSLLRFNDVAARYPEMELTKHGSNYMRMMLMNVLVTHGESMSPTEISKRVFRTKHSITSMVDTLEKQGLVRREPSPKDRRSINIVVTQEGLKLFDRMLPVGYQIGKKALSCLDDGEVLTLRALLNRRIFPQ